MKPLPIAWAACVLGAAPLLASREAPTELVHAPGAGSTRRIAIGASHSLHGGELSVTMNGGEVPSLYLPTLHLESEDDTTLVLLETIDQSAQDGSPARWRHAYEEVARTYEGSMSIEMPGAANESFDWADAGETALEDCVAEFWVGEDGSEGRELVRGESPALDSLRSSLSFFELLPSDPVEVGDTWTASGETLAILWELGGELGLEFEGEIRRYMQPEFDERTFAGELHLTLTAIRGTRAHVEIDGKLTRTTVAPGDLSQVPVVDGTATDTTTETWEPEGELAWDLDANGLESLELDGSLSTDTHTVRDPGQGGADYESSFSVAGTRAIAVEVRREEGGV